jgi:hypothetical protein
MSHNTWTQYVTMDDPQIEPTRLATALEGLEGWEDDFDLGEPWIDVEADLDAE